MRLELLQGEFPVAENPGLDSTDPRFDTIATMVQEGDIAGAGLASEEILAEGIYDIRLIAYFLYAHWIEQGMASLAEVLYCLGNALLGNWEAVGPVARREKNVQNSLGWMFRQVLKKIQYEEDKNSNEWQLWQRTVSSEDVQAILENGNAFRRGLAQQMEDAASPILDVWGKIEDWMRGLERLVYTPPEPEQESEPEPESESETVEGLQRAAVQQPTLTLGSPAMPSAIPGFEVSPAMGELLRKLQAFETLIEKGNFMHAALVADDINQIMANFDPRVYFPKIFTTFFRLQALNFGELANFAEYREMPEWLALHEWFNSDIDNFVDS